MIKKLINENFKKFLPEYLPTFLMISVICNCKLTFFYYCYKPLQTDIKIIINTEK